MWCALGRMECEVLYGIMCDCVLCEMFCVKCGMWCGMSCCGVWGNVWWGVVWRVLCAVIWRNSGWCENGVG